jgi:hypothetical protein
MPNCTSAPTHTSCSMTICWLSLCVSCVHDQTRTQTADATVAAVAAKPIPGSCCNLLQLAGLVPHHTAPINPVQLLPRGSNCICACLDWKSSHTATAGERAGGRREFLLPFRSQSCCLVCCLVLCVALLFVSDLMHFGADGGQKTWSLGEAGIRNILDH